MKHTPFNNAVRDIRKLSMTPAEKQAILAQVLGTPDAVVAKQPVRSPWSVYSFGSWIQGHKLASVLAAILIVAVSGNSIVLAANESLPGDALYSLKVNVAEPIRVALAADPAKKAEIQTSLVQSRFEEAETLAARGQLDDVKEKEIADLIDRHVAAVSKNIEKVDQVSPEKAEDTSIAVEASMNAHAKILATLGSRRTEARSQSVSRIAEKAREDAKKFDVVVATAVAPAAISAAASARAMAADEVRSADAEDVTAGSPAPSIVAKMAVEVPVAPVAMSLSMSVPSIISTSTEPTSTTEAQPKASNAKKEPTTPSARQDRSRRAPTPDVAATAIASSTRATIEVKKQQKETEIYEKAKQRLEEEYRNEELKKPAAPSRNASSTDIRKGDAGRTKGRFDRNK